MTNLINNSFIALFAIIFCQACNEQKSNCVVTELSERDMVTLKKQIDSCNDRTINEQEFFKDKSGNLIPNGYLKSFYPNGKLKSLSFYKNGIQDSIAFLYYENGLMWKKNYLIGDSAGHLFGPQYYYSSSNFLDSVEDYSQYGEKWMTLRFENGKKLISLTGGLMHITIGGKVPYFDSIPIKEPLLMMNQVAKVDGMKTLLKMKIRKNETVFLDTMITNYIPFFNSSMTGIKHQFKEKGSYIFSANVELFDSINNNDVCIDSFTRKIVVY